MNIKLLKYFSLTAALMATTNLCFAMDPELDRSEIEAERSSSKIYSFSAKEQNILNQYRESFDFGFNALCEYNEEPERNNKPLTPFLSEIFKEFPNTIQHFAKECLNQKSHDIFKHNIFKLGYVAFEALRLNRPNRISPQLDLDTLRSLASLSLHCFYSFKSPRLASFALLNGMNTNIFVEEALWFNFQAVKSKNIAYDIDNLIRIIDGTLSSKEECSTYYNFLFPLLLAEDLEAQEVFNIVAEDSHKAYSWIINYVNDLHYRNEKPELFWCLRQRITDHIIKKYKPAQRSDVSKETYDQAIALWSTKTCQALINLKDSASRGHLEAKKKLMELRQSEDYKNPREDSHGTLLKRMDQSNASEKFNRFCTLASIASEENFHLDEVQLRENVMNLYEAVQLGNEDAIQYYISKIRPSAGYTEAQKEVFPSSTHFIDKVGVEFWIMEKLFSKLDLAALNPTPKKLLNPEDQKNESPINSSAAKEQNILNQYKESLDFGYNALHKYNLEPETTIDNVTSLLEKILKDFPSAVPYFAKKLPTSELPHEAYLVTLKPSKIMFSFLNALRLNRQANISSKLDYNTIDELGAGYLRGAYSLKEADRKSYLKEAIWYSIMNAKEEDYLVFERLLAIIDGKVGLKTQYSLYYNLLIPLVLAKDLKAEELFIQICLRSEGAVKCIQKHVKNLEDKKKDLIQINCLTRLIADFQNKEQENKGKKAYETALQLWTQKPQDAIIALREAVENGEGEAQKKLEELKRSKGYITKHPSANDHGGILKRIELQKGKKDFEYVAQFIKKAGQKNAQISEEEIKIASIAFFKAIAWGDPNAKKQEKKIKNSKSYKDMKSGIDKTYTDPYLKFVKAYYMRDHITTHIQEVLASESQISQRASSLPEQNANPFMPENLSPENLKDTSLIKNSRKPTKSLEQEPKSSVPIVIIPVDELGRPTTSIPLPEIKEHLSEEPKGNAAISTEVPISHETMTITEISNSPVSPPEEKKPKSKKTIEVSKKEKKVPLTRRTSLHKLERSKSLSQIQIQPRSDGTTSKPEKNKSKNKFLELPKPEKKSKNLVPLDEAKSKNLDLLNKDTPTQKNAPYAKLRRSLSDRDLKSPSHVQLSEKIITDTLDDLQRNGIVSWTWQYNTISATKNNDSNVHLTLHTHNSSDKKWWEKSANKIHYFNFVSQCDNRLKRDINSIGKSK